MRLLGDLAAGIVARAGKRAGLPKRSAAVTDAPTALVSGRPVPADGSHTALKPNGQQQDYVVLTEEERRRGFVRPLRDSYVHRGIRPTYPLRDMTEEERGRYGPGVVKFEEYPESMRPRVGRAWTEAQLNSGCGTLTRMARPIAETYARDPKFYGGTFCVGCGRHLPLEEFVWAGTTEIVGS